MRASAWILLAAGLLALLWLPGLEAQDRAPQEVRVLAKGEEACSGDRARCSVVEAGGTGIQVGDRVELILENEGEVAHELAVTRSGQADHEARRTPRSAAVARVDPVAPNATGSTNLTVPEAEALYLWCPLDDHEAQGLWLELPLEGSATSAPGPEQGSRRVPGPSVGGVLGLLGAAILGSRVSPRAPTARMGSGRARGHGQASGGRLDLALELAEAPGDLPGMGLEQPSERLVRVPFLGTGCPAGGLLHG